LISPSPFHGEAPQEDSARFSDIQKLMYGLEKVKEQLIRFAELVQEVGQLK
jgi:hypothetical protein